MLSLRLALRRLAQRRWSSLAIVAMLGLATGSNAVLYGALDALTHDPNLERVHVLTGQPPEAARPSYAFGPAEVALLEQHGDTLFSHIGAFVHEADTLIDRDGRPQHIGVTSMRAASFPLLGGERALLGRFYGAEDESTPDARVLVLSHALWQQHFGADPQIVGREVRLAGGSYTVIGVMPASFEHGQSRAWRPLRQAISGSTDWSHRYNILLKRRADLSPEAMAAPLAALSQRLVEAAPVGHYPQGWRLQAPEAMPLWNGDNRRIAALAFAAGLLLLLVASANVGNLMLARLQQARLEFALTSALGASIARVLRPHLVECLLLCAGIAALAAALYGIAGEHVLALLPPEFRYTPDWRVLPVMLALVLGVFVIAGLLPALRAARRIDLEAIRGGARSVGPGAARGRRGAALVVAQVALTAAVAVLALGITLGLYASLQRDAGFDPGSAERSVLTARITPPPSRYPDRAAVVDFWERLRARVATAPEIEAAGIFHALFMRLGTPPVARLDIAADEGLEADYFFASAGAFDALGMRLLSGRLVADSDRADAEPVVLINRRLAQTLGGVERALGSTLAIEGDQPLGLRRRIVGVVEDVPFERPHSTPRASVYVPYAQGVVLRSLEAPRAPSIVIRGRGDAAAQLRVLNAALAEIDPELAVFEVRSLHERVQQVVGGQRFGAAAIGAFALATLGIAAVGLLAMLSFQVAQRRRQLALQLALGATPRRLLGEVLGEGLRIGGTGLAIGVVAGIGAAMAVTASLPAMPVVTSAPALALLAALVLLASALASLLPALRAARTLPAEALRQAQ